MINPISKRNFGNYMLIAITALAILSIVVNLHKRSPTVIKQVGQGYELELSSTIETNYPPESVRAVLYIPGGTTPGSKLPLIIYYHSASTDPDCYKYIGQLEIWAEEKHFLLLSVQNRWALNINQDPDKTILDSLNATVEFITRLAEQEYFDPDHIYATGFSGGGFVALCAGFYRPDLVSGVGDFKGNFYQSVFEKVIIKSAAVLPDDHRDWSRLKIFLTMGGANEAPRVRRQVPEALEYLASWGVGPIYKQYPNEGHALSEENFYDFWELLAVD